MPFIGVGYLIASDVLTDVSYSLVEPPVNTAFPSAVATGSQTVNVWDPAMYVGALVVCGLSGDPNLEVVEITAVVVGTSFTATFANTHAAGISIAGPTFPVRQPTDPFFTQAEMLGYLSTAVNDFLVEVPLVVAVNMAISVPPTAQNVALPSDCMQPQRIAVNKYPLRETSQSNLDSVNYRWQIQAASQPRAFFRDKVPIQNIGVWPRANNTVPLEIVYNQRGAQTVGLADGFLLPDPFLVYVMARVLEFAFSKDGEQANPGLARYWNGRYKAGIQISKMFLEAMMDPNLEMAQ